MRPSTPSPSKRACERTKFSREAWARSRSRTSGWANTTSAFASTGAPQPSTWPVATLTSPSMAPDAASSPADAVRSHVTGRTSLLPSLRWTTATEGSSAGWPAKATTRTSSTATMVVYGCSCSTVTVYSRSSVLPP